MQKKLRMMANHWQLYLIFLFPLVHIIVFKYIPIYGIQIAFKKWNPILGITGSKWVGMKYFIQFFNSPDAARIIWNTLRISLINLVLAFPMPIILALAVNACTSSGFRENGADGHICSAFYFDSHHGRYSYADDRPAPRHYQ